MEKFSLDKWLQDKSRKVVTRDGREVRIICTDRKASNSTNVIGLAKHPYDVEQLLVCNTDGRDVYKEIQNDLFFADEEENFTEFETRIYNLINFSDSERPSIKEVKEEAEILLDLVRKELQPEFEKEFYRGFSIGQNSNEIIKAYKNSKTEVLNSLPKWKKSTLANAEDCTGFNSENFCYKGYYINYKDLFETLSKEE